MTHPPISPETVYWLEDPDGTRPPEIAGNVEYRALSKELCFYDTQRPHTFPAEFLGVANDGALMFRRARGGSWLLRPLTCDTFNRVFRSRVHLPPDFSSDEELQSFYRTLIRTDP